MKKHIESEFDRSARVLTTTLSGTVNEEDITSWAFGLNKAADEIPSNSRFKILVNLYGFKAENFQVHQQYRTILPLLLAEFDYRIGYLDMFPEAKVQLKQTRGIRCVGMANVHQDESKMIDYNKRFSKPFEKYFTDPVQAVHWIYELPLEA